MPHASRRIVPLLAANVAALPGASPGVTLRAVRVGEPSTTDHADAHVRSAPVEHANLEIACRLLLPLSSSASLLHAGSLIAAFATPASLSSFLSSPATPSTSTEAVRVVFEPRGGDEPSAGSVVRWVAPHAETAVWTAPGPNADQAGVAAPMVAVAGGRSGRSSAACRSGIRPPAAEAGSRPWTSARSTRRWSARRTCRRSAARSPGAARPGSRCTPALSWAAATPPPPASGRRPAWSPSTRPSSRSDRRSGSRGSARSWPPTPARWCKGAHLDVFGLSYAEALEWGVQERTVLVFPPALRTERDADSAEPGYDWAGSASAPRLAPGSLDAVRHERRRVVAHRA